MYRQGVPLGQPVFLAKEEFKAIMRDKDELGKKWQRHLDKLNAKKSKDQEIKTPIPSNPDRCFVCNTVI